MSVNKYDPSTGTLTPIAGDPKEFTGTTAEVEAAISQGLIGEGTTVYITDDNDNPITIDSTPTSGSANAVASGGVYDALNDKLTILNMPKSYGALNPTTAAELINDIKTLIGTKNPIYRFINVNFGTTFVGTMEYIYSSGSYYINILLSSYQSDEKIYKITTRGSSAVYFSCLDNRPSTISNISIFGTTNTTGSTIAKGTYFYVNGDLCKAKTGIANNATLTEGTNYEKVSSGLANVKQDNLSIISESFSYTASSTNLEKVYTATLEPGHTIVLAARPIYVVSAPTEISIRIGSGPYDILDRVNVANDRHSQALTVYNNTSSSNLTFDVYCAWESAGANRVIIKGFMI